VFRAGRDRCPPGQPPVDVRLTPIGASRCLDTVDVSASRSASRSRVCRPVGTSLAGARGSGMGLRGLFRRSTETALPALVPPGTGSPEAIDPLTAEQAAELQAAWDELARAGEGSGVDSFNACTRTPVRGLSFSRSAAETRIPGTGCAHCGQAGGARRSAQGCPRWVQPHRVGAGYLRPASSPFGGAALCPVSRTCVPSKILSWVLVF
jgi:hypothetical protein